LLIVGCNPKSKSLPYYNTADFTPLFISPDESVDSKITHHISSFEFFNQEGEKVSEQTLEGKIHVADFFFTSCGSICPVMTNNMTKINEAFPGDSSIVLLSFSVTPWIDNVATLKKYATDHHITNPNWHLLTGNKSAIYELARKSYFAEEQIGFSKDSTEFLHTEHFILVDKQKRLRGIYNGTLALEIQQLIADIRLLKEEY